MRSFWFLLLALPACQHEPTLASSPPVPVPTPPIVTTLPELPPSIAPSASSAPSADSPAAPPPPQASWRDGLPAVSDDGTTIAVANDVSLGARGDSRVELDLLDVARDEVVRRIIVFDPDYPMARSGEPKARRVLAERSWVKLSAAVVEEDPGSPVRQGGVGAALRSNRASGDGLSLEYREPVLVVRDAATGAELLRTAEPRWSEKPGPRCPGCGDCPAPLANVTQVWSDRAHGLLLVAVGFFGGSDLCWEPPDEYHVVRVPVGR
jgi:hypothetical protein